MPESRRRAVASSRPRHDCRVELLRPVPPVVDEFGRRITIQDLYHPPASAAARNADIETVSSESLEAAKVFRREAMRDTRRTHVRQQTDWFSAENYERGARHNVAGVLLRYVSHWKKSPQWERSERC